MTYWLTRIGGWAIIAVIFAGACWLAIPPHDWEGHGRSSVVDTP